MKIALSIFIIAHGLVHAILAIAPNPADPDAKPGAFFTSMQRSWLLPQLGLDAAAIQWIGLLLVTLSTLGFILAGLGIFGMTGLSAIWQTVAIVSSIVSIILLILFWHPWLPVGVGIDVLVLIALLWNEWLPIGLFNF